jgi:[NiFe] hydrogenase diaphorase moiety large subunit
MGARSMKNPEDFINSLFVNSSNTPDLLLQHLHAIQNQYSHIPKAAIELLSERLHVSQLHIYTVIDFYAFLHRNPRGYFDIRISDNITDRMLGNQGLLKDLCKKLGVTPGVPRADGRVSCDLTSCTGMCDQGPAVLVNGMAIPNLIEKRVHQIIGRIEAGIPVKKWPKQWFVAEDNIQRPDKLLAGDFINGSTISALAANGADAMLDKIDQSGLRGRGGAGFSTATKWRICRDAPAKDRYVVCNADEGEPGTFKDRVLLNSFADCLFEGMTLCAGIIGSKRGFVYLRGEYLYLREALEKTLQDRRDAGLLGNNILGHPGLDFDIEIHMGAGAYICGEESALIESLEGKRGIPRNRPPYPVTQGYKNQPTVVNNVETLVAAAKIGAFGAQWFNTTGTEKSHGTKLLSVSGDCERPGIYEYPFGVTIRQILIDCGANDTQAVQVSGPAGATIPPQEFYRKIAFEDIACGGSFMIFNQRRDLLKMVLNFARFFRHESCGFCTPCRIGSTLINDLVEKVLVGHATSYDLDEIRGVGALMQKAAHCGLGATAPNSVLDTLDKFPGIYSKRLHNTSHTPAFDLDAALEVSRRLTGRDDEEAHIRQ